GEEVVHVETGAAVAGDRERHGVSVPWGRSGRSGFPAWLSRPCPCLKTFGQGRGGGKGTGKKSQAGKHDLLLVARLLAALVDRQEAVLDRQRQHRHRGAVDGAIGGVVTLTIPGPRRALAVEQDLVQRGAVGAPVVVAHLERRLGAVVDRV